MNFEYGKIYDLTIDEEQNSVIRVLNELDAFLKKKKSSLGSPGHANVIGYVPPDPKLCFSSIWSSVTTEIEKTAQINGSDFQKLQRDFDLNSLLGKKVEHLSGGESLRAALALFYAASPNAWVLDRCLEWMDVDRNEWLRKLFTSEASRGAVIIEVSSGRNWRISGREVVATKEMSDIRLIEKKEYKAPNLVFKNLETGYGNVFRIGPFNEEFYAGDRVILSGPNGAGKSTLARALARLIPYEGEVCVMGQSVGEYPVSKLPVLYSFQNPDDQLFRSSVKKELIEVAKRRKSLDPKLLDGIIQEFDFHSILKVDPLHLPLGKKRLISVAGALVSKAPVIILDEPSAFLTAEQYNRLVNALLHTSALGCTLIAITHDIAFKRDFATRNFNLVEGKLVESAVSGSQ